MKTSLALAIVLFVLYLAGCDIVDTASDAPADVQLEEQQDDASLFEDPENLRPLHTLSDTTSHTGTGG